MPSRFNLPIVTRTILIVLIGQSLLSAAVRYRQWTAEADVVVPYLTFVPYGSLIYPWTLVTTTLVESNVFTLAITGATIFYGGKYLERAWNSKEFAKFLVIVSLIPNVLTFGVLVTLFALTKDLAWSLTPISGGIPLQISFLVAFSQLVPAHTVTLFRGLLSLRVPRFPLLYITLILILSLTPLFTSASFLLSIFAFLTSWTYLRFYKPAFPDLDTSQSPTLRGDASESFALAEFFPEPLKSPVAVFSSQVFNLLVLLRLCTPFSQADIQAARGDPYMGSRAPPPGSSRAETERRRALALKALDQRLHAATAAAATIASSGAGPSSTAKTPQPPATVGSDVSTQPKTGAQGAMTSEQGGASDSGEEGERSRSSDGQA